MSSNKFSNPWMPASNGVFGGGGAYNKNAYSVRGRGAANNPWVQQSAWWENIVEGNYQKGFGQASHSNEYYSTEPVSLQAMRRMRTITVLVAGGAILGAAAAAGLFSGGGGAAAAGGAAATTAGGGGAALGSGGLFAGGGLAGTGITTAQALTTAGSVVGGIVGNSLLSSQGASAGQGGNNMGNGGNGNSGGNTPMNALGNPLTPGWPPTQPSGNPQPNQQSRNRRRRREESDGENMDTSDYDYWEQQYQEMTRNTMRNYGMSYAGNGSYAKTTGRDGYGNPNKPKTQTEQDSVKLKNEEYHQNSFEYRDSQDTLNNDFPWQSQDSNTPNVLSGKETGWGFTEYDGELFWGYTIPTTKVIASEIDTESNVAEKAKLLNDYYVEQGVKYDQPKREFGKDVKYADCSSFVISVLKLADANIFNSSYTGQGQGNGIQGEIQKRSEASDLKAPYRLTSPQIGDIAMWKGHIGIVTAVNSSTVSVAQMGSSGAKIAVLNKSDIQNSAQKWAKEFWGFWTPKY